MNEDRIVVQDANQDEIFQDDNQYGPLELNLLERIEQGLNYSDKDSYSNNPDSFKNDNEKYTGPKEVIFVSGWANVNSIYRKYFWGFIAKIFIGLIIMMTFLFWKKNLIYIASALCFVALTYSLYYLYMLMNHQNSNIKVRMMYWVDFSLQIGYTLFFFGLILAIGKMIPLIYLPLFALPYLGAATFVMFYKPEDKIWISQKKFCFFEAI